MRDIELPLARILGRMEEHGVLLDGGHLKALSKQVG
jgi:DNA polymerase I-like protein with 3'-5' exonuclease and polymerase domains